MDIWQVQVTGGNAVTFTQGHGTLEDILEFTDIAGEAVVSQC